MEKLHYLWYMIAILHSLSWVCARSHQPGLVSQFSQVSLNPKQGVKDLEKDTKNLHLNTYEYMSRRVGSAPPNCRQKCGGCKPCIAVQVPSSADHLAVQYTNYEPEGWKCKCGRSFFDP